MKYTLLGFSQKKLIKLGLTIEHAVLIRYFVDFRDTGKMIAKKFEDDSPYYWLKYEAVSEQLPILKIKKDTLYRKFRDIINARVLEFKCEKNQKGSFSFYRAGPNLEKLLSKSDKEGDDLAPGLESESDKNNDNISAPGLESESRTRIEIRTGTDRNPDGYGLESVPKDKSIKDSSIKDTLSKDKETGGFEKPPEAVLKNIDLLNRNETIVPMEVEKIIELAINEGKFSNHLKFRYKNKRAKEASKTFKQIVSYIKEINSGAFYRKYEWDLEWVKKQRINHIPPIDGYHNYKRTEKIILKSARRAGKARTNKIEYVPKSMTDFFYNPETKKSRFLYFLNNDVITPDDIKIDGLLKRIPEGVYNATSDMYDFKEANFHGRELVIFWGTVNKLCSWYRDNRKQLHPYNLAYNDNGWGYHCGSLDGFIRLVCEYVQNETGRLRPQFLRTDRENSYWQGFRSYLLNHYNIEIFVDVSKEKKIPDVLEDRKKERYENEIHNEMKKIRLLCDHDNIPLPTYDEMHDIAEKRLKDDELEDNE